MKTKSAELMPKKSLSNCDKSGCKARAQNCMLKNPYPSMIKVGDKQERITHAKNTLYKHDKSG